MSKFTPGRPVAGFPDYFVAEDGRVFSAPDLLAMLVEAHDIIDAIGQPETAEVAARMRATIAKARGDE